jgi:molecular chaperone GrpE
MTKKKEHTQEGENNQNPAQPQAEAAPRQEAKIKEQEYYDQLLRLQADFENYRKRTEKEKPLFIQFGRAEVIKKLLPLYDTLLKAEEEINKKDADAKHIKQGLNMLFEEFGKVFKSEGVEVICCKGKPYDPMTQEVVTTIPCDEKDDGTVTGEICRGVTLNGTVLRPAQVIVGKKKEEAEQETK